MERTPARACVFDARVSRRRLAPVQLSDQKLTAQSSAQQHRCHVLSAQTTVPHCTAVSIYSSTNLIEFKADFGTREAKDEKRRRK